MSKVDKRNQTETSPVAIGEIRTGVGRARQTSAPKRPHTHDEHPLHVRGVPEYNPLYDAFESDIATSKKQTQGDFRPITPPKARFVQSTHEDFSSTYDKPRSYQKNAEQPLLADKQRHNASSNQKKVESSRNSEVDFLMDNLGGDTQDKELIEQCKRKKQKQRRRILYNFVDFLALSITCLIFGLIYLLVKPVQRGFFCDDTSIQYPFNPDTIPMWLLGIYGGVGPVLIFFCVEFWVVRPFSCQRGRNVAALRRRQKDYVKVVLHTIFLFGLGIAVCFLITEVGKRTIGRLRPYYLTICNPEWSKLNCTKNVITASGSMSIPQYVLDHNCNPAVPTADLQEAKLSFPSGHSSYATYAFMFLFVYFEMRLVCPKIKYLKPFFQCICVAVAFFTCLSRVTDHKHHATDVIGGALIGFCIAVFTAVRVGTYLWALSVYCETDEETKKDRLPDEERITLPGLEVTSVSASFANEPTPHRIHPTSERERNSNRSNYDNVVSTHVNEQQHRTVLNGGKPKAGQRKSPKTGFEEAHL